MKVLQINSVCKEGSTGKIAYDLHTCLINEGHESSIWYGRGSKLKSKEVYKFSNNIAVNIHALMSRIVGITGIFSNYDTKKLFKYIEEFKPDVVHLHNIHGYYVNSYRLLNYLKKNNIKTVITLHDDWLFTGNCGYAYDCNKWKNGCGKCNTIKEYPKSLFLDFTKLQYRMKEKCFNEFENLTIVAPSKWLADRARQSFLGDKHIKVIHNGIDIENVFHYRGYRSIKEKHNLNNEKIILAVTPNFSDERKGGKYIIKLARLLKEEKSINAKVIIIGVNENIENIPDNVIILPRTKDQIELSKYYSLADVFVITSICENFPTVCIEALACNTPVVGFDAGGTKETAPIGNGKFVKLKDVEQLKKAIISYLNNIEECNKDYSVYAKENYDIKYMYNKYYEIYND